MAIKKQEFYEGAALHILARSGLVTSISYEPPFFTINGDLLVLLKYTTKNRSPWGFTFTPAEQKLLKERAEELRTFVGLVCGSDGVAALIYSDFTTIAAPRNSSIHISCYRDHNQHYEINGPDGTFDRKIAPSSWRKILGE